MTLIVKPRQYVQTDAERDAYNEFKRLSEESEREHASERGSKKRQLEIMFDVYERGLYKSYYEDPEHPTHEISVTDWLNDWYVNGINTFSDKSTFYPRYEHFRTLLADGMSREDAIEHLAVLPSIVSTLKSNGAVLIEKTGDGEKATYKVEYTEKGKEIFGEEGMGAYLTGLNDMPKMEALKTVYEDVGRTSVRCSSLAIVNPSEAQFNARDSVCLWGEWELIAPDGNTPYQFRMMVDADMPSEVINLVARKLKANFRLDGQ